MQTPDRSGSVRSTRASSFPLSLSARSRTLDILAKDSTGQTTQDNMWHAGARPRLKCLKAKMLEARKKEHEERDRLTQCSNAASAPLFEANDSSDDGDSMNVGAGGGDADCDRRSRDEALMTSPFPDLRSLQTTVVLRMNGTFWDLVASSINGALKAKDYEVFVGKNMEDLISEGMETYATCVDALKAISKKFECRVIVLRVNAFQPTSKVDQILLIQQQSVKKLTSPIGWKTMLVSTSVSTLLIVLDAEAETVLHQVIDVRTRMQFAVVDGPLLCRLSVTHQVVHEVVSSLGFFEPSTVAKWKVFPEEFPDYQWCMGAALALLCEDCFTRQNLVEAEQLYRSICLQGGYLINSAKSDDNCLEAHFEHITPFGVQKIRCQTLASAAVQLLKKRIKDVKVVANGGGVLPLDQAKTFLSGASFAADLKDTITEEAVIESSNMHTCFNRSGEMIAANSSRAVLVRYIAVMYGYTWMSVIPRMLPDEVRQEMLSTIRFVDYEDGCRARTITRGKSRWLQALSHEDLVETIWEHYDESWRSHLEKKIRVTEVRNQPVPEKQLKLMRRWLRVYKVSRSKKLSARYCNGGQLGSGFSEEELFAVVWKTTHKSWQQRCSLNKC